MGKKKSVSQELVTGGLAAGLGFVVPGGALAKPLLGRLVDAIVQEHERNCSLAWDAATAESGLTREELTEFVEENPRGVPMYLSILHAAGTNGYEETLRAMGTAFGAAASSAKAGEMSEVEKADVALRAMSSLTPSHFRVLKYVLEHPPEVGPDGSKNFVVATSEADSAAATLRLSSDDVAQYLLNLAAAGLVRMVDVFGGTGYEATALGVAVSIAARSMPDRGR